MIHSLYCHIGCVKCFTRGAPPPELCDRWSRSPPRMGLGFKIRRDGASCAVLLIHPTHMNQAAPPVSLRQLEGGLVLDYA